MVRLISLRRETLPGIITEQAKLKRPIMDWSSFKATFFLLWKWSIAVKHLATFSIENLAFCLLQSNSIPANDNTWARPSVFSGAMGTPKSSQKCKKFSTLVLHLLGDSEAIRKSFNMWIIYGISNLFRATYSIAVLRFSKLLHELASSIDKQQST